MPLGVWTVKLMHLRDWPKFALIDPNLHGVSTAAEKEKQGLE